MDLTLTEAFLDIFEDVDLNGKSLKACTLTIGWPAIVTHIWICWLLS